MTSAFLIAVEEGLHRVVPVKFWRFMLFVEGAFAVGLLCGYVAGFVPPH